MRAHEFVIEGKKGKLNKHAKNAMHKTHAYSDGYHTDGTMNFYRVGMAAAMADGGDKPVDLDERTWYSTSNVSVPYSDLEHKMMHQAFKTVKTNVKNPVNDKRSREADDTHKTSPVRARSKNRFGV
jgi:hypothetical protein